MLRGRMIRGRRMRPGGDEREGEVAWMDVCRIW